MNYSPSVLRAASSASWNRAITPKVQHITTITPVRHRVSRNNSTRLVRHLLTKGGHNA